MNKASDMRGKAAVVTGAASGLGRGVAIALASAGADVCAVDIAADKLAETADAVRALGVRCLVQPADMSVADNCAAVVAAAVAEFGRLELHQRREVGNFGDAALQRGRLYDGGGRLGWAADVLVAAGIGGGGRELGIEGVCHFGSPWWWCGLTTL